MRILNLIGEINLNKKSLIENTFLKFNFAYIFINAVIRWNFNINNPCFMPNTIPFKYLEQNE